MNVLQNLVELYNHLPMDSTYRDVVKGILMNLEEVADATIYDVAELTCSSRTTVWRMIQKMGYASYSEFRHALKQSVSHYPYYNRLLPIEKKQDPIEEVFAGQLKQVLKSLKGVMSEAALQEMAALVDQKQKVSFYFPFRSSAVSFFQQNLAMAGKETGAYCLLPDMLMDAEMMDEEGLVFCVTIEHAEAQDLLPVFQALKERGAVIASLAGTKGAVDMVGPTFEASVRVTKMVDGELKTETTNIEEPVNMNEYDINHWIDAIQTGGDPAVLLEQAAVVTRVIEAIYKSAETGETIFFD